MIPASRFKRFLAYCVDTIILGIPSYFIGIWAASQATTVYKIVSIFGPLIPLLYFVLLESSMYQASLGKKLFNLYVSDMQDQRLTLERSLGRYLLLLLPSLPLLYVQFTSESMAEYTTKVSDHFFLIAIYLVIVFIWISPIFFTQARTTFYDMLSGTRVNKRSTTNSPPSMSIQN